jgi:phage replication O-like protein O
MPQLENYTKIANELLEAIAAIRIPGEAMQILLVIIRKTCGYHKKKDAISLSQFASITGMKKPNVCRAVKKLLDMNIIKPLSKKIIKIIEKDNAYISEYELNKDFASWKPLSKKITLSKKIINVIKKDNLPLSKKIPTKETITKERKKEYPAEKSDDISGEKSLKEKKPNAWGIWIDVNREFGRTDPFPIGKDTKAAKNILSQIKDSEKYADILRQFLDDNDNFLIQNGHSISFLTSRINKYLNQCYKPKISDSYALSDDQIAEIYAMEEKFAADES